MPDKLAEIAERDATFSHLLADTVKTGLPAFSSIEAAFQFAEDETHLGLYTGLVSGSERYNVELPSGGVETNWLINAYFQDLFRPFGLEVYAFLAPHLEHPDLFVQVGAAGVLSPALAHFGYKFQLKDSGEERHRTVVGLLRGLERERVARDKATPPVNRADGVQEARR